MCRLNRYSRLEIERIITTPFSALSRQEMSVKKLLSKFHDDPEIIKRNFGVIGQGFDAHLAERTRIKSLKGMSQEEKEWMSIDTILHPEVCIKFVIRYIYHNYMFFYRYRHIM